jgi:hypothetical protein
MEWVREIERKKQEGGAEYSYSVFATGVDSVGTIDVDGNTVFATALVVLAGSVCTFDSSVVGSGTTFVSVDG